MRIREEAGTVMETRCYLERLGDPLYHVVQFLQTPWLCALDAAWTNEEDRRACWLRAVRLLNSSGKILYVPGHVDVKPRQSLSFFPYESTSRWLHAFRWIIEREVALPEKIWLTSDVRPTELLTSLSLCSPASVSSVRHVSLESLREVVDAPHLIYLERCTNLEFLDLSYLDIQPSADSALRQLQRANWTCFSSLRSLNLMGTDIGPAGVDVLIAASRSQLIKLIVNPQQDETLRTLCFLENLESLELYTADEGPTISPTALTHLSRLTKLRTLDFECCRHTDDLLRAIASIDTLREIRLNKAEGLTRECLTELMIHQSCFSRLTSFRISESQLSDECFVAISRCTALQVLDVSDCYGLSSIDGISCLSALKSLDLGFSDLPGSCLVHMRNLTKLEYLDLTNCDLSDPNCLLHLQQLSSLTSLVLYNTRVDDAGLANLHALSGSLESVDLIRCNVSEAGVSRLLEVCTKVIEIGLGLCELVPEEELRPILEARGIQVISW